MALRTEIVERTNDEILLSNIDKKFRPAYATYDGLPAGGHILTCAIKTGVRLSAAQMDALETAIQGIAGVQIARVLSQGPINGVPALPAGFQVNLEVQTGYRAAPIGAEE